MHKITQTWKGRESQVTYNLFLRGPALQSPKPMLSEYGISKHLNCISKSWQSEKEFQPFSHHKTKRTHYFSKCTFFCLQNMWAMFLLFVLLDLMNLLARVT